MTKTILTIIGAALVMLSILTFAIAIIINRRGQRLTNVDARIANLDKVILLGRIAIVLSVTGTITSFSALAA